MKRLQVLILGGVFLCGGGASIRQTRADDSEAYEKCVDSVAWVVSFDKEWGRTYGTGVLIDANEGFVLTACHVVGDGLVAIAFPMRDAASEVIADLSSYRSGNCLLESRVIFKDLSRDLALLRISDPGRNPMPSPLDHGEVGLHLDHLFLGRSDGKPLSIADRGVRPGEAVFTIGCSGAHNGGLWRYAGGHVRQVFRYSHSLGVQEVDAQVIEMTVPINCGDSGGPVINRDGKLVGINMSSFDDLNQVHHAIDLTEIKEFLAEAGKTPLSVRAWAKAS